MRVRGAMAYLLAACVAALSVAVRATVEPWLYGQLPFITTFGAVAVAVWIGGVGPALLAAVIGFVGGVWWLLDPTHPGDVMHVGFMLALAGYALSTGLIIAVGQMLIRTQARLEAELAQRREAEARAHENAETYRYMVDLNPQATWTALPDGMFDPLAERWQEWTGTSPAGEQWLQNVHPDDRAASVAAWRHAIDSGTPYDLEHRIRRASGEYRWARSRAFPRRDEQGAIVRWYGSTEDVHARKTAEGKLERMNAYLEAEIALRTIALQDSEARLRAIFSTSLQYQLLLGADGKLIDANPTSLREIGATLEDVLGLPFWETPWFSATHGMPEIVREAVLAVVHGGSVRRELAVQLPAGLRYLDFAMRPVIARDGSVVAIVPEAVDVTDRRQAEEKLRQAQKMEAVGQLTGGVAHDFNNMLQVISSNLHLVSRFVPDNEPVQGRLAIAQGAVARGAKLANQLLAFGRRQALEPKVVHVGKLIVAMEDMLHRTLGETVDVDIVAADDLWNTLVDPAQIENAVLNLAINGRDAMAGGGRLSIQVGNSQLDGSGPAGSNVDAPIGQYVLVAVGDSGAGMTPEVIGQAFEPFFSTKPVGTGSGLGLSMVYGFVKQSGGHVRIASEVGHGTTVRIYLPRAAGAEDVIESAATGEASGGSGEVILVVEDDDAVRSATVEMLRELGYRVLQARDATEAKRTLDRGVGIDLLFTDVVMPGPMQATELVRLARERDATLAVLFTSGYTRDAIVHDGRLDEGVELLPKPYTLDALARRIRGVLGDSALPASVAPARAAPDVLSR